MPQETIRCNAWNKDTLTDEARAILDAKGVLWRNSQVLAVTFECSPDGKEPFQFTADRFGRSVWLIPPTAPYYAEEAIHKLKPE